MTEAVGGRSHGCGTLRAGDAGREVRLYGWVGARRDHGGVYFVDLRDRSGIIQVVADEEATEEARAALAGLRLEDCVAVRGRVRRRDERNRNPERPTGEVEVLVERVEVLARCDRLPFEIVDDLDAPEELRLRYRYLDLRRRPMLARLELRSRANHAVRCQLVEEGFLEVETPLLTRSTPEGARDYLVPSRVRPGSWYALPQSPQLFKQLCMVGGIERYFQLARCLRDEDLRADRQPEFTQLDLELSFVDEEEILAVVERVMARLFAEILGRELPLPLPRMSHAEAIRRFASDKPDLRNPLEICDLGRQAGTIGFRIFDDALAGGGLVRGVRLPGGARLPRKRIDALEQACKDAGAAGMAWCKVGEDGPSGPLARFLGGDAGAAFLAAADCRPGDLLAVIADRPRRALVALDALRRAAGRELDLVAGPDRLLWVTDFPLFEQDDDGGWFPAHHPFTAPHPDDLEDLLAGRREGIRSRAYDLVMNGVELGSGSIRIHRRDVQEAVFAALGIGPEEARRRFRFLLDAFRFGPPPHGGFALGLDRLYALLAGADSIREVIAFPKTTAGGCPLTEAPAPIDPEQLAELGIRFTAERGEAEKE
ncbi:MAG: aspartate--tRNA ligase [Planctomycetota bacterium]|nr:MAG: aspartate--tRNA ligase [Planctomycetota bacterium]